MHAIEPLWKGIITGLLFTLTFGTVFFSLIQTSIKRGHSKALYIALGVLCSDSFFIAVSLLGTTIVAEEMNKYDMHIRVVGFAFLLFLGIRSIIKKEKDHTNDNAPNEKDGYLYVLKGAMLNSINPMVLISWMGVATYVESTTDYSFNQTIFYFTVVIVTMFGTMFGIIYSAGKLRTILSANNLHRLNVVSGVIFVLFSLVIVFPVIERILGINLI